MTLSSESWWRRTLQGNGELARKVYALLQRVSETKLNPVEMAEEVRRSA